MWNGYTGLHITKLDVLGGMPTIKVCVSYSLRGKTITTVPAGTQDFLAAKPNYISVPGFPALSKAEWKKVIVQGKTKGFSALPTEARAYIAMIERLTKIPVLSVSVGPERDAIIFAKK
jgi:adenylosuccinate synthase